VPVDVVVRTYDEEIMYLEGIAPIHEYHPMATRSANGTIHLGERIVLHEPSLATGHDLVVEIEVARKRVARDKAKRAELAALGVRSDRFQQYYIDQIDRVAKSDD
jgi:hypothetical protein